jgi:CRISPR/Cas system-associated exonuclease Cas4 (RecB family)
MKKPSYIRVTSVLSDIDASWYRYWVKSVGVEEAERISRESAEFGTGVHKLVEAKLLGMEWAFGTYTDRQVECAGHINKWLEEQKVKPLHIEKELIDKKLGLIGHADLIAEINGHNYVVDYKTSKKIGKSYALQLAAYSYMAEKQFKIKIDNGVIVRTPNDPKAEPQFEVKEYHGLKKQYWPMFKSCLAVYKYFKGK